MSDFIAGKIEQQMSFLELKNNLGKMFFPKRRRLFLLPDVNSVLAAKIAEKVYKYGFLK